MDGETAAETLRRDGLDRFFQKSSYVLGAPPAEAEAETPGLWIAVAVDDEGIGAWWDEVEVVVDG